MFVCSLNLICLQNLHQGYVPQNLTRFLKARDWDPSKAYQMVSISIYLSANPIVFFFALCHLMFVVYPSYFSVAWLFKLETAKSDWQYIICKFAYNFLSYHCISTEIWSCQINTLHHICFYGHLFFRNQLFLPTYIDQYVIHNSLECPATQERCSFSNIIIFFPILSHLCRALSATLCFPFKLI
jgi:hypothetical protein